MSAEDYGTDIGFVYDETTADTDTENSDLGLVDGIYNLYQAIQNRLLTPIGTLPLHPDYGSRLHTLIGNGNNPLIEMLAKMMVVEALQPEDRIALIRNIDVSFTRTTGNLSISIDIVSIFSASLSIPITIGT
ncbi:MAG: hypothetical protein DRP09_13305 [Candidatus Thorarchaeota archaeon]|nr:MAG: hypothetical protein DRP09_13305 [Candidatus Thorarchaeota archaeon]